MDIKNIAERLIPADKVPSIIRADLKLWLEILQQIPPGKALPIDYADLPIKPASLRGVLRRLTESGQIQNTFKISLHKDESKLYITNKAKPSKKGG